MRIGPPCPVDLAGIRVDDDRLLQSFPLAALQPGQVEPEPYVDIQAALMTDMPVRHRPTAWLRHVADQHDAQSRRIEALAHQTVARLKRAIAINLVIAWRIMVMTLLGRSCPDLPAEVLFSDLEINVLRAYAAKKTPTALAPG